MHAEQRLDVPSFSLRDRATDRIGMSRDVRSYRRAKTRSKFPGGVWGGWWEHENSTGDIALTWYFISRLGRCVSPPLTATGPVVNEREKGVVRLVSDLSQDASEINATTQLEAACGPLLRTEASSFFIQAPKSSALPKALFLSDGKISSCARHRRLRLRPRIGSLSHSETELPTGSG